MSDGFSNSFHLSFYGENFSNSTIYDRMVIHCNITQRSEICMIKQIHDDICGLHFISGLWGLMLSPAT